MERQKQNRFLWEWKWQETGSEGMNKNNITVHKWTAVFIIS